MKNFAILAAAAAALTATPAIADISSAKMISCEVAKGARCKNGTCQWREASARDKEQILVLDLAKKEALMRRKDKQRKMGVVASDKVANGVRTVVVKRKPDANPAHDMVLNIKTDGAFSGWRAQQRVMFQGMCKAG